MYGRLSAGLRAREIPGRAAGSRLLTGLESRIDAVLGLPPISSASPPDTGNSRAHSPPPNKSRVAINAVALQLLGLSVCKHRNLVCGCLQARTGICRADGSRIR
jgi:hypothetical protein